MKKYVKPAIYCESFRLTEMIAGPCGTICNSTDNSCDVTQKSYQGGPFTNKITDCEYQTGVGSDLDIWAYIYCYWNGASDTTFNIFTS